MNRGHFDEVEAHVKGHVTHRDFHGPLFENTRSILERLIECSEIERALRLYRAAIAHRLKALTAEAAIRDRPKSSRQARTSSAKWVNAILPAVRKMIKDYEAVLERHSRTDPELKVFQQSLQAIENP